MFGERLPSRHLNDNRFILGLTIVDFGCGIIVFVLASRLLENTRIAPLGFLVPLAFWVFLIPIRIKYRRKVIRDFIIHALTKGNVS